VVEKDTFCVDPELRVAVMVLVMDCPRSTDLSPSLPKVKSNFAVEELTVSVKLVVLLKPSALAVTVIV
jgi:hypothetical protein